MSNLLRNLTSRGLSFAYLAKVPAASTDTISAEDKSGKKGKKADDENPPADDQNTGDGDSKKSKAAGADDTSEDDDEDDDGTGDGNTENSKKGKKAVDENPEADDDDDEDEMRGKGAAATARRRERARCAAIMGSKAAARNPVLAANLAFNSAMTRKEAIALLDETPGALAAPPAARRNPVLGGGGDQTQTNSQAIAASWDHAMQKARPPKR